MIKKWKCFFQNHKKKGFTLVELLAVIVILAIILVVTIPIVLGKVNESKQKAFETVGESMKKYLIDNYKQCIISDGNFPEYDSSLFDRENNCALKENISDTLIKNSGYSKEDIGEVFISSDGEGKFEVVVKPNKEENSNTKFKDLDYVSTGEIRTIPNKPDVSNGLVPVVYDEGANKWKIVAENDPTWYDYDNQKWANAVILKNKEKGVGDYIEVDIENTTNKSSEELDIYAMYVWIPRFSYTIGCHETNSCYGYRMNNESDKDSGNPSQTLPGAIDIKFVSSKVKEKYNGDSPIYEYQIDANGMPAERYPRNWYTHPAFTFGNQELSGIWVGKFETSVATTNICYESPKNNCRTEKSEVRVLPNVLSLTLFNVYNFFEISKDFTKDPSYGIIGDAHMMKNSEWGAVAYLSQSIYGKYGNSKYKGANKEIYKNDSGRYSESRRSGYTGRSQGSIEQTGKNSVTGSYKYDDIRISDGVMVSNTGTGASTTGTIYGIYDMSGGAYEYVTGYYSIGTSIFSDDLKKDDYNGWLSRDDWKSKNSKYFDYYPNFTMQNKSSEVIGHATIETKDWYDAVSRDITSGETWVLRGGNYFQDYNGAKRKTIFHLFNNTGTTHYFTSFRSVIS